MVIYAAQICSNRLTHYNYWARINSVEGKKVWDEAIPNKFHECIGIHISSVDANV